MARKVWPHPLDPEPSQNMRVVHGVIDLFAWTLATLAYGTMLWPAVRELLGR